MSQSSDLKKYSPQTRAIHGKPRTTAWQFSHHLVAPITTSTTFRLDSLERGAKGFVDFGVAKHEDQERILIYDRLDEPNTLMLEEILAELEQAEIAVSFGSGMGAISTCLMSLLNSGQKIICHPSIYGCTYSLIKNWLPKFNITTDFIDLRNIDSLDLTDPKIRVIYFESIANPTLEMVPIHDLVARVQKENRSRPPESQILTICDNTFATPWALRPLSLGVDFSIHSLTKNVSGFGTEMGGVVLARKEFEVPLKVARKDFGAIMTPQSAWTISTYGLQTQEIRFQKQQASATKIAHFLEENLGSTVRSVTYPGLQSYNQIELAKKLLRSPVGEFAPGTMLTFEVSEDPLITESFVNDIAKNAYTITLAVSLGLTKTLIELPGFMTHSAMDSEHQGRTSISPNLIRLSVGLESPEDIISDLKESLDKLQSSS